MTNQEKIKILKSYCLNVKELTIIEDRLKELRLRYLSPKSSTLSNMPRGTNTIKDNMCSNMIAFEKLEGMIVKKQEKVYNEQARIEKMINALNDQIHRQVLTVRYLQGNTWERTCVVLNYSWTQIHRLHVRALNELEVN